MDRLEFKAEFTVDEAGTVEGIAWPFVRGRDVLAISHELPRVCGVAKYSLRTSGLNPSMPSLATA
jgi:hypothetical protein